MALSARKTSYMPELLLKFSPKMYKFHEWCIWQSLKGIHSIGMLAAPEDFVSEGNKVVWLDSKIFMKFTI
jgi:hypothetical protein